MGYVDWKLKGPKIGSCTCAYGCPCEFNARPTHGDCSGLEDHLIEEGWFGDVRLDGLVIGARYRWPGPVHEGGGVAQGLIDERANERQREALLTILSGKEQEPTTVFNIYGATIAKEFDPAFGPMEFACDFASSTGRFAMPGVVELTIQPIRNPVTGEPHPAKIVLPAGFEFRSADMASGTFAGHGDLALESRDTYAALTYVAYGPSGIIAEESHPLRK